MSSLNIKALNRGSLNKKIFEFYSGLIENFKFIISCSKIKPIDDKKFLNFKNVKELVEKNYSKNKYRKNFKIKVETLKNDFGNKVVAISSSELNKIENTFSDYINGLSDTFQTEFGKKLSEINKVSPEEVSNFKQAVFNLLVNEIENDFKNEGLPENYSLKIEKLATQHA